MSDDRIDSSTLPNGWSRVIDELDEKHAKGHERLRLDFRGMDTRVESNYRHFDDMNKIAAGRFSTIEATLETLKANVEKPDAMKLTLSTTHIVALVTACLIIAGSGWRLAEKIDTLGAAQLAQQKLYDLQLAAMQDAIRQTSARYELLRIDVQALKETVISGKGKTP
jgi:hypothetical protein